MLRTIAHPESYPAPLITLTDLGLSRHISQPPASPLLTTRCGSEDYAAPEILLSQPYDGRATDAWALGVLLYALMEGRLPFDPTPPRPGAKVSRARSRAAHRIARCDWIWSRFGDVDGEWDESVGQGWEGARDVVDGLLRKVTKGRWSMDQVHDFEWVKAGIQVEGGLKREHD
jgi:protein-serine/threonine kinase